MTEQQIQSKIIKYINAKGGYCIKVITASKAGVHDIIACIEGKFYSLEVKTETGKPSALQIVNRDLVRQAGGISEIVRSVEEVAELVRIN